MYDELTLKIDPASVRIDPRAIATFEEKMKSATSRMGKWAKAELKEYILLCDRLLRQIAIILGEEYHPAFAFDFGKTFEPRKSDHLATPGQSWTERYSVEMAKEGEFVLGGFVSI
jgi:hypothetical protein